MNIGEYKPAHLSGEEEVWIYHLSLRDGRVKVEFMCKGFLSHLVNLPTSLFFCRGDLDVCLLRRQMEFGQRGSAFWLNMCVFLQCLLPSDCTVDLSAKA